MKSSKDRLAEATDAIQAAAKTVEGSANKKNPRFESRKENPEEPEEPKRPLFVDLAALLDAGLKRAVPTVAPSIDGKFLFYPKSVNEIHAEPGVGKSNVGAVATIAVILASETEYTMCLDPEDTAGNFIAQLISLSGADPRIIKAIRDGRIKYIHDPSEGMIEDAQKWAIENKPTFVCFDGLAELMASEGLNEDVAGDVLRFFKSRVRPFAEKAGAGVLVSDHVAKGGNGGGYGRGSGAKLGRYDGVSYEIRLGEAYSPTQPGFVKLVISKDRKGGIGPKGKHVLDLHFEPTGKTFGDGDEAVKLTDFRWEEPACGENGAPQPTQKMADIVAYLGTVKDDTSTNIRKAVGGKGQTVDWAIRCLVSEKQILRDENKRYSLPKKENAGEGKNAAARGKV